MRLSCSETALAQGALEEARRIQLVREFTLERPGLAFQLRGDELGSEPCPDETARAERVRAVEAGCTRQI